MKTFLALGLLIPVFFSCNRPSRPSADHYQLTESTLYNIDSVRAAEGTGGQDAAGKRLLEAINIYKNKKDPAGSIPIFKAAILLDPSSKAYFELGSALSDNAEYPAAISAFHIAEQLDYSPLANVMFGLSKAYAGPPGSKDNPSSQDSISLYYMQVALQMGYAHPNDFRNDASFAALKDYYAFHQAYSDALSGSKDPDKMLWDDFRSGFQPVVLPLTINTVWIDQHPLGANDIGYDYEKFVPEMRTAKFSREVEKEYYFCALLRSDPAYTALLYAGKNNFLTDANQHNPVFYFLVTYDRNGRIIDKIRVAGQENFTDAFKVFTMQPNYSFEVKDFKNIYKDDPEKAGYDSNYVVRSEPLGSAGYRIRPDGKFEKTDAPLAISFPPNRSGSAIPQ
jgi:hypothetical protein